MRIVTYTLVAVVLGTLGVGAFGPRVWCGLCGGPIDSANMQMKGLADAMEMYWIERERMPASLDDLPLSASRTGEPYIDRVPLDPWGRPYLFRVGGVAPSQAWPSRASMSTRSPCADSGARTIEELQRTRNVEP